MSKAKRMSQRAVAVPPVPRASSRLEFVSLNIASQYNAAGFALSEDFPQLLSKWIQFSSFPPYMVNSGTVGAGG